MKFGLSISNRSVALGSQDAREILDLVRRAEASGRFDSVWVGDSLLVNPRLEAVALLSAIAAVTDELLIGTACMGSIALRQPIELAQQWASLDQISNGRTRLIACSGGGIGPLWQAEAEAFGVPPAQRRARMFENMDVLRQLWSRDDVTYEGAGIQFRHVTLEPKPLQQPCPIWLATNATRLSSGKVAGTGAALRRVGRVADGWMTHSVTPEAFSESWAVVLEAARDAGRDPDEFGNCLYHNINVSSDEESSLTEAMSFLGELYESEFTPERTRAWCTVGSGADCVNDLQRYKDCGVQTITLRLCSKDQGAQLERVINEVLPYV
jgi:alkanesulfonate monooxygenase SsuD/methylene tetrahydromethanopterin reductase-like flavin-dependent oxidoreductase (luciferase family)